MIVQSNRWVCKSTEELNLEDIKQILEKESKGTRDGEHFDVLKHTIRLDPEIIATNNSNYLSGTLYFEDEFTGKHYELSDNWELQEHENPQKTTYVVDFWTSSNGLFLYKNSKLPVKKGKELLSSLIFKDPNKIKNLQFDIERIEQDVKDGVLQGMWTYHFTDRQGNVKSGMHFGDNVNIDSMYDQTIGAPKNYIGIEKQFDNEIVKVAIYKKGTIRLLKDFEDATKIASVFEVVEEFSKYATTS